MSSVVYGEFQTYFKGIFFGFLLASVVCAVEFCLPCVNERHYVVKLYEILCVFIFLTFVSVLQVFYYWKYFCVLSNELHNEMLLFIYDPLVNDLFFNTVFVFGADSFAWALLWLASFVTLLVWYYNINSYSPSTAWLINGFFLVIWCVFNFVFFTLNLFWFFVFFEIILLPMSFLIGMFGSRTRKIRAFFFLYMYTSIFSFFFLLALMYIWIWFGSYDYLSLRYFTFFSVYNLVPVDCFILIFILFFATFAAKLPLFPLHLWLPEAHVESPTGGSVVLAALLLKLGAYGIVRFLIPFFPAVVYLFNSYLDVIAFFGCTYGTLAALIQVDLKKIIAYSSIAHMSFSVLGFFSQTAVGCSGALLYIFGHGFISSALFFLVGMTYTRWGTRLLKYYSGLSIFSYLSFFFLFFSFANLGFPGTVNFVSESLIFVGLVEQSKILFFFLLIVMFVGSLSYSIWVYLRIMHGSIRDLVFVVGYDLRTYEVVILLFLMFLTVICGLKPGLLFNFLTLNLLF